MTFIKEVGGISIYVNGEGRFIAEIGDRWINKPSLREVEKEIGKFAGGLPVCSFDDFTLRKYEFISVETRGSYGEAYRDKSSQRHLSYHDYYKSTPELIAQLSDLEERFDAAIDVFEEEKRAILAGAEKVSPSDFRKPKKDG